MNRRYYFLSIIGLVFALQSCKPINSYNPYLGQKLPGITPELFAPSIVNTDDIEINAVFNSIVWNGKDKFGKTVGAGMYLYKISAGKFRQTKKMILLK